MTHSVQRGLDEARMAKIREVAEYASRHMKPILDDLLGEIERLRAERLALARLPGGPSYFASQEEHDAAWELAQRIAHPEQQP